MITAVAAFIGLGADLDSLLPDRPCWMFRPETRLDAPYNIVVADPAVAWPTGEHVNGSRARELAKTIAHTLQRQIVVSVEDRALVAVGSPCGSEVADLDDGRAATLERVRKTHNGDIAISLVLRPRASHTRVDLEFSIGGGRLDEAAELAGYSRFGELDIGDFTDAGPTDALLTSAAEQLETYVRLLRAVYQYSAQQYMTATHTLTALLGEHLEWRTRRLALVLMGNAYGRLAGVGDLGRAKEQYLAALEVDSTYSRARLGLAEIAYQQGASRCAKLDPAHRRALATAYDTYRLVAHRRGTPDAPDTDARAEFGMGRVETCRLVSGEISRLSEAVTHLRLVTGRYESDHGRTWLRTPAAEAYGLLGAIHLRVRHNSAPAMACYQRAADIALAERAWRFQAAADQLRRQLGAAGRRAFC